ncbi:MAG TPA: hypothetical protein VHA54_03035, partial [Solirubrobacterales bacterium]|nr:hypothetical protein [Solirubrobacterales bacterium]
MRKLGRFSGRYGRALAMAVAVVAVIAAEAPGAQAGFGISSFEAKVSNPDGSIATQAGGHPASVTTTLNFNTITDGEGRLVPDESLKDIEVELPPGFVGSTTAVPKCSTTDLVGTGYESRCPLNTQIGVLNLRLRGPIVLNNYFPIYNMVTPSGSLANFGMQVFGVLVYLEPEVRTGGDYGITVASRNTNQTVPVISAEATIWGVPADPSHDIQRCRALSNFEEPLGICNSHQEGNDLSSPHSVDIERKALLTNVGRCSNEPFVIGARADSWMNPSRYSTAQETLEEGGAPVFMRGCNGVQFEPTASVKPESRNAGTPTGLEVDLSIPSNGLTNPEGVAQSALERATIVLPEGMGVNAASAEGLEGCSEAQFAIHSSDPAHCPGASKLGTLRVETPLIEKPLPGSVYLATQGTNPFNSLLAAYIAIADPDTGLVIKVAGKVSPDPQSGRLTISFSNVPPLPFANLHVQLKGGDRAVLVTPDACGTYEVGTELSGWAHPSAVVTSNGSFVIDRGCGVYSQFKPGFEAGTTNPLGGGFSPFVLRVTRQDGEQNVSRIQATLPEGVLAKLAGVPLCPEGSAGSGDCPSASQIGTATVGTGAGSNPLYVPQPGKAPTAVYLAGPYKGGPYSLVAKVPAQAGPFDLGTVAVRNAISIDPTTAQVSVKSDPLPQILQGIPIAYRDIRVMVDRPDFTLNPTSCDPMEVKGTIGSAGGKSAGVSDRFQVANCERLAFKPKLALSVKGATHRNAHPAFKAVLTMPKGGANIQKAQVTLPKTELLENAHIRTICTRVQYNAGAGGGTSCPAASIYGKAKAW